MSALYDSGLFDSDDMAEAYSNGFHAAKQTLQITVTTVCPICLESLLNKASTFELTADCPHRCQDGASSVRQK